MWNVKQLTDANNGFEMDFDAHGSVFIDGTVGGGTVDFFLVGKNNETDAKVVSSVAMVSLDDANRDAELPNGKYLIALNGSTGGDVKLFHMTNVLATG